MFLFEVGSKKVAEVLVKIVLVNKKKLVKEKVFVEIYIDFLVL